MAWFFGERLTFSSNIRCSLSIGLVLLVAIAGGSSSGATSTHDIFYQRIGGVSTPPSQEESADDDGDDQKHENADDLKVEQIIQELFLGFVVYPQDRGEVQFTTGFFHGFKSSTDGLLPVEIEYGLTDRFQLGLEVPIEFLHDDTGIKRGVGQIELTPYYNFYSSRESQSAYGVGFSFVFPSASTDIGPRACTYEPFFVAYHKFPAFAVNFSSSLAIEDSLKRGEQSEVSGDLDLAFFRQIGKFVPILEANVEIERQTTSMRLAPAIFWKPVRGREFGVSIPIGLSGEAAHMGVFVLLIW